jgi:hypothetical protein
LADPVLPACPLLRRLQQKQGSMAEIGQQRRFVPVLAHRQQHLVEGDAMLRILKLLAYQPVRLFPRPLARIVQALRNKKGRYLLDRPQ